MCKSEILTFINGQCSWRYTIYGRWVSLDERQALPLSLSEHNQYWSAQNLIVSRQRTQCLVPSDLNNRCIRSLLCARWHCTSIHITVQCRYTTYVLHDCAVQRVISCTPKKKNEMFTSKIIKENICGKIVWKTRTYKRVSFRKKNIKWISCTEHRLKGSLMPISRSSIITHWSQTLWNFVLTAECHIRERY